MCCISIGNCSKYNIYFFVSILCYFMIDLLMGLNTSNKDKPGYLFSFRPKIKKHALLDNFVRVASVFFGGLFLYIFDKYNNIKGNDELSMSDIERMNNNLLHENTYSRRKHVIIVGILFALYIILTSFIGKAPYVGFWTFEILYICIISHFIFKIKIYKHKKIAIYIMLIISILDFVGFCFPWTKHEIKEDELTDTNVFDEIIIKYGLYAIPLIFIANELNHMQRDYVWIQSKYLMDVRAYSPSKLFMVIGSIGCLFVIIFFMIFTYVPCKSIDNIIKLNDTYKYFGTNETFSLNKEYCKLDVHDNDTKILSLYYDSFKLVIDDYSNTKKETIYEIFILIPLLLLFNLINEISRLMMVRYTDPNNILIYKNIHLFLQRIVKIIINKGDEQYITYFQFFLAEIEELVSIISNMIYIEVIELNFCGLDYEIKKNINKRGLKDMQQNFNSINKDIDDDDNDVEETESNKSSDDN